MNYCLIHSFHPKYRNFEHLNQCKNQFFAWKHAIDREYYRSAIDDSAYQSKEQTILKFVGREYFELGSVSTENAIAAKLQCAIGASVANLIEIALKPHITKDNSRAVLKADIYSILELFRITHVATVFDDYLKNTSEKYHWILAFIKNEVASLLRNDFYHFENTHSGSISPAFLLCNKIKSVVMLAWDSAATLTIKEPVLLVSVASATSLKTIFRQKRKRVMLNVAGESVCRKQRKINRKKHIQELHGETETEK